MSALGVLPSLSEDHFLCPLCRELFSDPVSTPCGHNFCKACLSQHWASNLTDEDLCHCPTCGKRFHRTTEFSTNAVLAEMSVQLKKRKVETLESAAAPWSVKCDVCADFKQKAIKSCLGCAASFCAACLEPHGRVPALMKHRLTEPVEDLQERTCRKHGRILELYCRTEGVCVCLLCGQMDHKDHQTVPVEEEGARQKETIHFTKAHIKQLIGKNWENINKLTKSSQSTEERANEEAAVVSEVFGSLLDKLIERELRVGSTIKEKLQVSQEEDRASVRELQAETAELQRKLSQLEELQQSTDHFQLLQKLRELRGRSDGKDRSGVWTDPDPYVQTVRKALSQLLLSFKAQLKRLTEKELARLTQYKESVTFDPPTAGTFLTVTESGTRLKLLRPDASPPPSPSDRPEIPMVFAKQGFASGRHYWQVKVGLRGSWDVGVAYESARRTKSVLAQKETGFFTIRKRKGEYQAACSPHTVLYLCPKPKLVGVYLDYEGGKISFYHVAQKQHVYSYTRQTFTEKLFPCFYLNSSSRRAEALVIKPVADAAS